MARHRIRTQRDAEPIAHALTFLPSGIMRRLQGVEFVAGVDPLFVGVHTYESTTDGRSYHDTACCLSPHHQQHRPRSDRATRVILPAEREPRIVIHELGHALDEAIDWDRHDPMAVTAYAQTDRFEAFAEAFTAWIMPNAYPWAEPILHQDQATLALFEELAR
jgi:hypothetical protein